MKTPAAALLLALTAAACHSTQPSLPAQMSSGPSGASGPGAAAQQFLAAARAQNAEALSAIWGTPEGPARNQMSRDDLVQREYILLGCLRHDTASVLDMSVGPQSGQLVRVRIARGPDARVTTLTAVPARDGRWYVEQVDMHPLRDFCVKH